VISATGIGTSWILAPALVQFNYIPSQNAAERFEQAQSTAMVATMPASIAAAVKHYKCGHLSGYALPLLGGAIFGGYIGGEVLTFDPDEYERLAMLAFTFVFGCLSLLRF